MVVGWCPDQLKQRHEKGNPALNATLLALKKQDEEVFVFFVNFFDEIIAHSEVPDMQIRGLP